MSEQLVITNEIIDKFAEFQLLLKSICESYLIFDAMALAVCSMETRELIEKIMASFSEDSCSELQDKIKHLIDYHEVDIDDADDALKLFESCIKLLGITLINK